MSTATDRKQWLDERKICLGSSDAAAILGIDPSEIYGKTPLSVYCDKLGLTPKDEEEKEHLYWGRVLEPAIAAKFAAETGRTITDPGDFHLERHPKCPYLGCTVDRLQYSDEHDGEGILEIKTTDRFNAAQWKDGPTLYPQIQIQHQFLVTGRKWGSIAVLIGGNTFRWWDVEVNYRFQAVLFDKLTAFWERIVNKQPPDASPADFPKVLNHLHPDDSGKTIELPEDAAVWDEELRSITEEKKRLESREKELKAQLCSAIGDATYAVIPGVEGRWSWKTVERKGYEVKPSKSRQLRKVK